MSERLAAQSAFASPAAPLAEQQRILGCLNRIRRRLWAVRFAERLALGLTWGAAVGVGPTVGKILYDRFTAPAIAAGLVPVAIGGWAWYRSMRRTPRFPLTTSLLRTYALTAAVVGVAAIVALILPAAAHLPVWTFAAVPVALYLLLTAFTVRPIDTRSAAIFVDQQVGLKERVATALELLGTPASSPVEEAFRRPVIDSALAACSEVQRAKVAYSRADGRLYAAAATAAIVAVGLGLVTPLPAAAKAANRPYLAVADKGRKLQDVLQELNDKKVPQNSVTQEKLKPLQAALTDLRKGNMSPFEANERLAEEKSELQKEQDQMDAGEKVARALDNIKDAEQVTEAGKRLKDANVKSLSGEAGGASAKESAQRDLHDAAKALGDKVSSGAMSPDDKKKLAGELSKAAGQADGDPALKQDLEKAADAAERGDGQKLADNLGAAGERMAGQTAERQLSGDAVRQAMAAIDRANNGGRSGDEARAQAAGDQGGESGQSGQQDGQNNSGQGSSGQEGGSQQGGGQQAGGQEGGQQGGQEGGQQQGNGQQAGSQGNSGGGQQASAGQASGSSGGSGGGPQANSGSTNLRSTGGPGDHSLGRPLGGTSDFVKVYDENPIANQGKTEKVSGAINPLAPASGTQEVMGQADKKDATIQTYQSQLPSARKRALDDLQTQQIPPQYRDLIRNYYTQ